MKNYIFVILLIAVHHYSISQTFIDMGEAFDFEFNTGDAIYGNGVSFFDFNHDGWDDLTFGQDYAEPLVYQNNEGIFELIDLGLPEIEKARSVIWVDIDNDGDSDLYIAGQYEGNFLFQNTGDMNLVNISETCGLFQDSLYMTFGTSWGDYNNDNFLDIYICNYNWMPDLGQLTNFLYRNNGDGTFTDVTEEAGVSNGVQQTFQSVWVDHNRDGLLDISVINDRITFKNAYYENNGDGTFTEKAGNLGLNVAIDAMSNSWADYDNDGLIDQYVSNSEFNEGNRTLKNIGDYFLNYSDVCNTQVLDDCWGAKWMDIDNDMDLDIYVPTAGYFPGSPSPNHLFYNDGNSEFTEAFDDMLEDVKVIYCNAIGDYNNDGAVDLASITSYTDFSNLWENQQVTDNNYVKISLEGIISNKDGISSWIELYAGGITQTRFTLMGQDFMSQNSQREIFGLGENEIIDSVIVSWQSGWVDTFYNLEVNQTYHIIEGSSFQPQISASSLSVCENETIQLSIDSVYTNIEWSTEETESSIDITEGSMISVSATNSFGLTGVNEIEVTFSPIPEIEFSINENLCFGDSLASISLTNLSETGYTSNTWNDTIVGTDLIDIPAGEYIYYYVDGNNCMVGDTIQVEDPEELIFEINTIVDASCFEACDGNVVLIMEGGAPDYTVVGETESLCADSYEIQLIDANGCAKQVEFQIEQPEILEAEITTNNSENGEFGSADVDISGGTEPYEIDWNNLDNEELPLGEHSVTITDANYCSIEIGFEIFLSIEEWNDYKIQIFPNPVRDYLYITTEDASIVEYEIFSIDGKRINHGIIENSALNLQSLEASMYIIKLIQSGQESFYPIIKD